MIPDTLNLPVADFKFLLRKWNFNQCGVYKKVRYNSEGEAQFRCVKDKGHGKKIPHEFLCDI